MMTAIDYNLYTFEDVSSDFFFLNYPSHVNDEMKKTIEFYLQMEHKSCYTIFREVILFARVRGNNNENHGKYLVAV